VVEEIRSGEDVWPSCLAAAWHLLPWLNYWPGAGWDTRPESDQGPTIAHAALLCREFPTNVSQRSK
jgi:hypothetical protein